MYMSFSLLKCVIVPYLLHPYIPAHLTVWAERSVLGSALMMKAESTMAVLLALLMV